MRTREKKLIMKCVAMLLIVAMVCPVNAMAVEPRASNYLDSYNAYPYAAGDGEIQVWFHVQADDYMTDIGSLSIEIHESKDGTNFYWVDSFTNGNTSSMLGHNKYYYSSHVSYYDAVVGYYYKAYVCIYAGDDTGGDTRYFWTGSVKAT